MGKGKRDTAASADLWVVWVISAYRGPLLESGVTTATYKLGITVDPAATNPSGAQRPIYLYTDTIQRYQAKFPATTTDLHWQRVSASELRARTLAHEILHRFGGQHGTDGILGDTNGKIIDDVDVYNNSKGERLYFMNLKELKLVRDSAKDVS